MLFKAGNEGAPLNYPLTFGFCLITGSWDKICAQCSAASIPFRWAYHNLFCQIDIRDLKYVTQEGVFKEAWEAFQEWGEWVRKGQRGFY